MITIDGWITIGTKVDMKKFEQQIKELENKIDSEEKKQELLNNKTKEYESDLQKVNQQMRVLTKEHDEAIQKAKELNSAIKDTKVGSPENKQLTREFYEQVSAVGQLNQAINKAEKEQSRLQSKVSQTRLQHENSVKAVDKLRGKISQVNLKRQQTEFKALENSVNNVKSGIVNTIGQIGKMALAVFGVRSAYMALRRASSTLAQYNEQYAKNLEYIRFALAQTLAPILEWIVGLTQTLLGYINTLSQTFFGINLFANASSKAFQQMSNSAGKTAKSTKEIKNNLASFDELNVLNTKDTGAGEEITQAVAPSFDLSSMKIETPEWLNTLKDNIINTFTEIADEIYRIFGPAIDLVVHIWDGLWTSLQKAWDKWGKPIFENLGIAIEKIGGIFQSLWDNFLQPIFENLIEMLTWLWDNHLQPLWENLLDLFGELINGILQIWNQTLAPFIQWLVNTFGPIIAEIVNVAVNMFGSILGTISDVVNGIITVLRGIIEFVVGVFTGDWEKAWQGVKDIFKGIWQAITGILKGAINLIIDFINGMITGIEKALNWIVDKINSLSFDVPEWVPGIGGKTLGFNIPNFELGRIPKLAQGGIVAKPTQAIIGEDYRKEAVLPLESNTEWMDMLADRLADRIPSGSGDITIRFEGTIAQLVRALKPHIEAENKRAGTRIIAGGAY